MGSIQRRIKRTIREGVLHAFARIVDATEARRAIFASLGALVGRGGPALPPMAPSPYGACPTAVPGPDKAPVFVTARYRTGSTLLWNCLRAVPTNT